MKVTSIRRREIEDVEGVALLVDRVNPRRLIKALPGKGRGALGDGHTS